MVLFPFFRLSYVLFYLLTFGLAFYPTNNQRLRQPSLRYRGVDRDQSLTMRTLLIDNFDSYTYNIWQLLSEVNGEEPIVVYNNAFNYDWDELLLQLPAFDNIVISPGPGSPDVQADFGICKDAILRSNLPVLGVCLGHQGIAHSFGGIVKRAIVPMHGRLSPVSHTNTGLFEHIPQDTKVVRYHSLIVENDSLPDELKATAWTADRVMMGLQHVSKPIYGVQFHPESISTACGKQLFINFREISQKYHDDLAVEKLAESVQIPVSVPVSAPVASVTPVLTTEEKSSVTQPNTDAMEQITTNKKNRNIIIAKKKFTTKVNVNKIFRDLYGTSSASFWLDSSSSGPVQGRTDNSTALSYFGDLDSCPTSYAIEYTGDNKLVKRTTNNPDIERFDQNIFEYLDDRLEENKNIDDVIHFYEELGSDSGSFYDPIFESNNEKLSLPFDVTSAYFGFLGYETRHETTEILTKPYLDTYEKYNLSATHSPDFQSSKWMQNLSHPMAFFMHPSTYVTYDHADNAIYVVSELRENNGDKDSSNYSGSSDNSGFKSSNGDKSSGGKNSGNSVDGNSDSVSDSVGAERMRISKQREKENHEEKQRVERGAVDLLDTISRIVDVDSREVHVKSVSEEERGILARRVTAVSPSAPSPAPSSSPTSTSSSSSASPNTLNTPVVDTSADNNTNITSPTLTTSSSVLYAVRSKEQYRADIQKCLEYIKAGESYEICLTLQFQGNSDDPQGDEVMPLAVYESLRSKNPAPYSCFLHYDPVGFMSPRAAAYSPFSFATVSSSSSSSSSTPQGTQSSPSTPSDPLSDPSLQWCRPGGFTICSSSPERYLKASKGGVIESKPIKGTARRNILDLEIDRKIAEDLKNDEKSQAENLMVVDLVRNDFGRVCEVGSVSVPNLMRVETFASVHQLVSTIRGQLQPGRSLMDAVVATFPGGSMTGAPKLRTMNIIEEIENRPRGIYSGAIGFIGLNGETDLNIVIRTAILAGGTVTVGSGGAIVAMSEPDEEVDEVILKAQAVSRPLGYHLSFNGHSEHK